MLFRTFAVHITLELMSESLSDRESFENSYYYFVKVLRVLAAPADEQAKNYGSSDEGAAWELKYDASAGMYLFNIPSCSLSQLQREKVTEFLTRLRAMTDVDFHDAAWISVRKEAAELLSLLTPVTRANEAYFLLGEE